MASDNHRKNSSLAATPQLRDKTPKEPSFTCTARFIKPRANCFSQRFAAKIITGKRARASRRTWFKNSRVSAWEPSIFEFPRQRYSSSRSSGAKPTRAPSFDGSLEIIEFLRLCCGRSIAAGCFVLGGNLGIRDDAGRSARGIGLQLIFRLDGAWNIVGCF